MQDSTYCPYSISLVCRGNVVSTDLHSHDNFVGFADYHGAESCDGFGQSEGGTAVQDAERLAGTVVYGMVASTRSSEAYVYWMPKFPINAWRARSFSKSRGISAACTSANISFSTARATPSSAFDVVT